MVDASVPISVLARMISVVIPTLNAAETLAQTLAPLVPAAVEGLVRELVVVDGGSADATLEIAEDCGARVMVAARGRGAQLAAGCQAAKGPWLLVLHADTILPGGWEASAVEHLRGWPQAAGYFRFALDDPSPIARVWEGGVALRCRLAALPYGDQGLLISKALYDEVGGYPVWPMMEDVALVRALGRARLHALPVRAVTSAARFRREGYARQSLRHCSLLARYLAGVAPERLTRGA